MQTKVNSKVPLTFQFRTTFWESIIHAGTKQTESGLYLSLGLIRFQPWQKWYFKKMVSTSKTSLRRQPTFRDATTGFPAKWRRRNEYRNSIPMTCGYWECFWLVENTFHPVTSTPWLQRSVLNRDFNTVDEAPETNLLSHKQATSFPCEKSVQISELGRRLVAPTSEGSVRYNSELDYRYRRTSPHEIEKRFRCL